MPNTKYNDATLDKYRLIADPEADNLLNKLIEEKGAGEARKIFDLLIRNIEMPVDKLPESVVRFINENKALPEWADKNKIKIAEEFFIDHGPKFLIFLYFKSLPTLYACKNGAQVLIQTGRLAHDKSSDAIFTRRIAETGQFLLDAMAPNGLVANGSGINAAQKVRLVHASIRQFIPKEHWNKEELGEPINQEDLVLTLMTFSISLIDALRQFNIKESLEQEEAYLHVWKIIGHYLGIDPELMPEDVEEGRLLLQKILARQAAPSEAGRTLTKALIEFSQKSIPIEKPKIEPWILIRHLVGPEISDYLGVSTNVGCLSQVLPGVLKTFLNLIENIEDRSEPLHLLIDGISKIAVRQMVDFFNPSKSAKFRIPESLRERWGL